MAYLNKETEIEVLFFFFKGNGVNRTIRKDLLRRQLYRYPKQPHKEMWEDHLRERGDQVQRETSGTWWEGKKPNRPKA